MSSDDLWIPIAIGVGSLLCLYLSQRAVKRRRIVDDTPTSKTTGVFLGMVELTGIAFANEPVTSYLAECECVHFAWSVEEQWEKSVHETYKDSEGKTQTRTRTESGWTTVASGGETIPFFLQDDHGQILVQPEGADLQTATIFSETCTPLEDLYFQKGPAATIAHSTHSRRFRENAIIHRSPVYVIGQARERQDAVAAEIAASKDASMFVISVHGEEGVRSSLGWGILGWYTAGGVLAYVLHRVLPGITPESPWPVHLISPFLFTFFWCSAWIVTAYNSIAGLRRRVEQAASNIDVMLKRRNDLVPSLVETVKAGASHEAALHEDLARLRTSIDNEAQIGTTVNSIAEAYPSLCADESFLSLQNELSATETRIALARAYYTEIASFFNARTEIFPDRWVCKVLPGLKQSLIYPPHLGTLRQGQAAARPSASSPAGGSCSGTSPVENCPAARRPH